MESVEPDERCYFGCADGAFHTLLYIPPPFNRTPRLCASHSKGWRAYKSTLKRDTRWPEDFWPWADKELEAMKRVGEAAMKMCYLGHEGPVVLGVGAQPGDDDAALCGPCAESWTRYAEGFLAKLQTYEGYNTVFAEWAAAHRRVEERSAAVNATLSAMEDYPPPIPASAAAPGSWYVVPSGEIEQAIASRSTSNGLQVGFLHVGGNPNDADDIRWVPGNTEVTLASEADVAAWRRSAEETHLRITAGREPATIADPGMRQLDDRGPAHFNVLHAAAGKDPWSYPQATGRAAAAPVTVLHRGAAQALLEAPAEVLQGAAREEPEAFSALRGKLAPLFSSESGEWQTDAGTFAWLNEWAKARWGTGFVLDVCASKENALCNAYLTKERSCLDEPLWFGPWFMNPEYGDPEFPCKVPHERCKKKGCAKRGFHTDVYIPGIIDFMMAARKQAQEGRPGMCLVPFRPGTEWWTQAVLAADGEQVAIGGDWAQGWTWVRWSSGLVVETRLISGRLSFKHPTRDETWTAPFPSVVIVFDRWK